MLFFSCWWLCCRARTRVRRTPKCGAATVGTELSHPCTDADENPAVNAAVAKYQERWTQLEGVYSVDAGDDYHNRVPNIEVHVEPASVASAKKQIPSSVDGVPVAIVPGEMPHGLPASDYLSFSNDPAEKARRTRERERQKAREKFEPAYTQVVQDYGKGWTDLPGVIGIGRSATMLTPATLVLPK